MAGIFGLTVVSNVYSIKRISKKESQLLLLMDNIINPLFERKATSISFDEYAKLNKYPDISHHLQVLIGLLDTINGHLKVLKNDDLRVNIRRKISMQTIAFCQKHAELINALADEFNTLFMPRNFIDGYVKIGQIAKKGKLHILLFDSVEILPLIVAESMKNISFTYGNNVYIGLNDIKDDFLLKVLCTSEVVRKILRGDYFTHVDFLTVNGQSIKTIYESSYLPSQRFNYISDFQAEQMLCALATMELIRGQSEQIILSSMQLPSLFDDLVKSKISFTDFIREYYGIVAINNI